MRKGYYSVYSKGINYENLIDLRSRPIEERREIARLGGLARQEQRRKQFAMRRALNGMLEADGLISEYVKKPKSRNFTFNSRKMLNSSANFLSNLFSDLEQVAEALDEEERRENEARELRRKELRKVYNRRYYLKRKERLKS